MRRERLFLALVAGFALLLAAAYAGMNAAVDPFSHWRDEASAWDGRKSAYALNRSLFKLVRLRRALEEPGAADEPVNLIVGDSTTNQLDEAILAQRTGERWINMSYGRATLIENVMLLEHVVGRIKLKRIVWGLPLTRFVGGTKNEMERSLWMAENPLAHLLTLESGRATLHVLREGWTGEALRDPELPVDRETASRYVLGQLREQLDSAPWPDQELRRIEAIERAVAGEGVPIVYALMPITSGLRRFLAAEGGPRGEAWRAFLAPRCRIDLGLPGERWPDAMFRDVQHLDLEHVAALSEAFADRIGQGCDPPDPDTRISDVNQPSAPAR